MNVQSDAKRVAITPADLTAAEARALLGREAGAELLALACAELVQLGLASVETRYQTRWLRFLGDRSLSVIVRVGDASGVPGVLQDGLDVLKAFQWQLAGGAVPLEELGRQSVNPLLGRRPQAASFDQRVKQRLVRRKLMFVEPRLRFFNHYAPTADGTGLRALLRAETARVGTAVRLMKASRGTDAEAVALLRAVDPRLLLLMLEKHSKTLRQYGALPDSVITAFATIRYAWEAATETRND